MSLAFLGFFFFFLIFHSFGFFLFSSFSPLNSNFFLNSYYFSSTPYLYLFFICSFTLYYFFLRFLTFLCSLLFAVLSFFFPLYFIPLALVSSNFSPTPPLFLFNLLLRFQEKKSQSIFLLSFSLVINLFYSASLFLSSFPPPSNTSSEPSPPPISSFYNFVSHLFITFHPFTLLLIIPIISSSFHHFSAIFSAPLSLLLLLLFFLVHSFY